MEDAGAGDRVNRIDLTPYWQDIVNEAARRSEISARKHPHLDRPWVSDRVLLGVMGETGYAIATHRKVQLVRNDNVFDGGNDSLCHGRTVDTKGRRHPHRDMLYELEGQMKADWYVVVECHPTEWWCECVGCCTRQMLVDAPLAPERITRNSVPAKIIYERDLLPGQPWMMAEKEMTT